MRVDSSDSFQALERMPTHSDNFLHDYSMRNFQIKYMWS